MIWRAWPAARWRPWLAALWTSAVVCGFAWADRDLETRSAKADSDLMRQRLSRLAQEMERARADLKNARDADEKLRSLLGMPDRRAILETPGDLGGPLPDDRANLLRTAADLRHESRQAVASFEEINSFIERERAVYRATPLGWPAPGRVTSRFGWRRSPFASTPRREFHPGWDIANRRGTLITATADGIVTRAGWAGGYGKVVLLTHGSGFSSLYGHACRLLVKPGDTVTRGQPIAVMGMTGRSTGAHLHYEVWRKGRAVNPAQYLATGR